VSEDTARRTALARFAGAVGANVLANLITVPILFAIGLMAGVFPRRPSAVATVLFFVLSVISLLFAGWSFVRGARRSRILSGIAVIGGAALIAGGVADFELDLSYPRLVLSALGLASLVCGIFELLGWEVFGDKDQT
jgi:hypothetical protein